MMREKHAQLIFMVAGLELSIYLPLFVILWKLQNAVCESLSNLLQ